MIVTLWRVHTKEPTMKRNIPGRVAGCVPRPTQKLLSFRLIGLWMMKGSTCQ